MKNKRPVAIVTGANHGIGAATARSLANAGTSVILNYLRIPALPSGEASPIEQIRATADGQEVAASICAAGGQARALEGDLTEPSTVTALFDEAERYFGPVTVLVNNAGFAKPDTFTATNEPHNASRSVSAEGILDHIKLNVAVPATMISELVRRRSVPQSSIGTEDGEQASVVNVSTDGSPGFVGEISYGASKHALESMSRAAALELGPLGIRVNVVAPGPIQTGYIPNAEGDRIAAATPLRRLGQPEDVADVITFLCSDQARWLTGQVLFVGGGWRVW